MEPLSRRFKTSSETKSKISDIIENLVFTLGGIVLVYATVKVLYELIFM